MNRRRLTFQLTPLLDLLLIVIFAQYMEVQMTVHSGEAQLHAQRKSMDEETVRHRQELESKYRTKSRQLRVAESRYTERLQSLLAQHRQAGSTLATTLNLSARLVEQILQLQQTSHADHADRVQQAVRRLQEQLDARGAELLRFIIRYDEMQKHVSVWEMHLLDNGQAMLTDGQLTHRVSFESPEEFAAQCFAASKAFDEPRPLVLVLMTWGDTQAGFRRSATDGLPLLMRRLRDDAGGTRWFDYSLMGYRPDGLLLNPETTADSRARTSEQSSDR